MTNYLKNILGLGSFCKRDVLNPMLPVANEVCGQRGAPPRATLPVRSSAKADDQVSPLTKGWEIDMTTGTPILMFEKCSVIQDEQAYMLMKLLSAEQIKAG